MFRLGTVVTTVTGRVVFSPSQSKVKVTTHYIELNTEYAITYERMVNDDITWVKVCLYKLRYIKDLKS